MSYGVYELILKTSKVISVYEKESKGKCSNYRIIICNLVFQISYFASHALIFVTEEISEQLDSDNFCCWNICWSSKSFFTLDHGILIQILNHYGITGIANN